MNTLNRRNIHDNQQSKTTGRCLERQCYGKFMMASCDTQQCQTKAQTTKKAHSNLTKAPFFICFFYMPCIIYYQHIADSKFRPNIQRKKKAKNYATPNKDYQLHHEQAKYHHNLKPTA